MPQAAPAAKAAAPPRPVVRTVITRSAKAGAPDTWEYFGASLNELYRGCTAMVQSGFLNSNIQTPQQAMVIVLKGRELGLPPMYSLTHIGVIGGKPVVAAEVLLALMIKKGVQAEWVEDTEEQAVLRLTRWDTNPKKEPVSYLAIFGRLDAERATTFVRENGNKVEVPLIETRSYRTYPKAMYRARAITVGARAFCPDLIGGISYTAEELGADMDDEGLVRIETIEDVPTEVVGDPGEAAPEPTPDAARAKQDAAVEREANGGAEPAPTTAITPAAKPAHDPESADFDEDDPDPEPPPTGGPREVHDARADDIFPESGVSAAAAAAPAPAPAGADMTDEELQRREQEAADRRRIYESRSKDAERIWQLATKLGLARDGGDVVVSDQWATRLGEQAGGLYTPFALAIMEEQGKGIIATLENGVEHAAKAARAAKNPNRRTNAKSR